MFQKLTKDLFKIGRRLIGLPAIPTAIARVAVESSVIKSVGYNPATHVLEIEFQSGRVYQYEGVAKWVYEEFREAHSLGQYFNWHIKGSYTTHEVTP